MNSMREAGKLNMDDLVQALKKVIAAEKEFVPLHEPLFGGREWSYV